MSEHRIPLAVPDLRGNEAAYLQRCIADGWVSSAGPYVTEFEKAIAALVGVGHGVAIVNGTAALHLALVAAGVAKGEHVIVPDWTFAATANAVLMAGAAPVFVDVEEASWALDAKLLERAIGQHRPAAIIAVHVLGHPADMDPIMAVARARGVPVIEDAAGAIGAFYKGRPVGSLGDAATFSFNGNKTVTTGGGGAIVTGREDWAKHARALSTQARPGTAYRYEEAGFNYRLPNVNAALGLAQIERLDAMLAAKRAIAARYDAALAGRADLSPMPRAAWAKSGCWLYSVRCATREGAASLVAHLDAANITARTFWEALSPQTPYRAYPVVRSGVADALSGKVVSLPCSSLLTDAEQARVVDALAAWRGAALREAA
jgi:dTDP-4-amino-4,6-dideoxygalactose transaminase